MIPLLHDEPPKELEEYLKEHPKLEVADFDSIEFSIVKSKVRDKLAGLQESRCVYCEKKGTTFQVEHIKPKGGPNKFPDLCFTYQNYANSCIQNVEKARRTCGQNKGNTLLPIEPTSQNCNEFFSLNTDGEIYPRTDLNRKERHPVRQTVEILGLNKAHLVLERKKKIQNIVTLSKRSAEAAKLFIQQGDFVHILKRLTK
ncbi:TIGR02646 family protein [Vibrio alginolyticus]|uniref:retron system putative HNH endonuclease n=1 Tax=Vibrio alginolyticus TaxID=663 RepID=UPI001A295197|nr:retron system putative HNH endonuclease [Vibrio alginolyticus]EGQ7841519.1 TIGR02646 family protein [Vibrio alginolyticus]ELA6608801.1 TIGR02646 family protein [Vibrio alginolyticus]MCS0186728.1 TIGR02646 family protein [Vibrio alginolyticus]